MAAMYSFQPYLSKDPKALLAVRRRFFLEVGQLAGELGHVLAELRIAVQHPAFRVGLVELGVVVRNHREDGRAEHLFELARRDVQALWRAVQNQLDAILAEASIEQ